MITTPDGDIYFNTKGNEGMATGGTGDVLSGIVGSLMAQGLLILNSAIIGVYIHGLAGDIAKDNYTSESLIATDLISSLPEAFKTLKATENRHIINALDLVKEES